MDFIKMIMELPGEKRSQEVIEHTEWNDLWRLIVTQGNHSENYLEQLYDYLFNKEGWVHKVQAELDGVQPYLEGVMTQPVGKAPDGSLWTYPSTESGTVPWGNIMGDITKQQDLIQKFDAKSDVGHGHDISTLTFTEGDIDGSWINYSSQSIPTSALENLSVTTEKLNNGAVTTAKIASSAVINDSIANGSVSGAKITDGAITRVKLAQAALYSPMITIGFNRNVLASDLGVTIIPQYSSSATEFTLTLNQAISTALPTGFEFATVYATTQNKLKIATSGIRVLIAGEGQVADANHAKTFTIPEIGGMVAFKKISTGTTAGDLWVATGNVEVVS